MNDGQARALAALGDGALTAVEIADRSGLTGDQVAEHLRHLTHIGFVRGTSGQPRVWGMTGLARGWVASTATGPGVQA
ncbi:hypothetical protein ACWFPY_17895 [Nocardia fluminea]